MGLRLDPLPDPTWSFGNYGVAYGGPYPFRGNNGCVRSADSFGDAEFAKFHIVVVCGPAWQAGGPCSNRAFRTILEMPSQDFSLFQRYHARITMSESALMCRR